MGSFAIILHLAMRLKPFKAPSPRREAEDLTVFGDVSCVESRDARIAHENFEEI
jgi:hypothetical protein